MAKKTAFQLSHLDKIYWPQDKIPKGELLAYYEKVAPYILPHLKDRPIVLHRYPEGIKGQHWIQKEVENCPKGINTYPIRHENRKVNYLLIQDVPSLLYAVNLGSIEIHPFNSTIKALQKPTYAVIDLDPEGVPFEAVLQAALAVRGVLHEMGIEGFCKTSGATGLHIYIPMRGKYPFEQVVQFAHLVAALAHQKLPSLTSLERSPAKRRRKVYLDFLQNHFGQTLAAPYSVRARAKAPVSTPLQWSEVRKGLDPTKFTLKNTLKRLEKKGDLFLPTLKRGANISKFLK